MAQYFKAKKVTW